MKLLALASLLVLAACAPSGALTSGNGNPVYEWVGCHKVVSNPASNGAMAWGPLGLDTDFVYFKQVRKDGSVGPMTTAVPC